MCFRKSSRRELLADVTGAFKKPPSFLQGRLGVRSAAATIDVPRSIGVGWDAIAQPISFLGHVQTALPAGARREPLDEELRRDSALAVSRARLASSAGAGCAGPSGPRHAAVSFAT